MTSLDQNSNQSNNSDLADQSLSSESIAIEVHPTKIISINEKNTSNDSNSINGPQIPIPNNAEEYQIQPRDGQDKLQEQLVEEEPQPTQNAFVRCAKSMGVAVYNAMYNAGGFLADLFGITTPRYAYAIHEYEKHQERVRQRQLELESELNGEDSNDVEKPLQNLETENAL